MKLRQIRMALWAASALLMALAVLACLWGLSPPVVARMSPKSQASPPTAIADTLASSVPPLTSFTPLLTLDLRQDLGGHVASKAPLAIKLTGTIMEPGRNIAMFQEPDGSVDLKAVGESAGGAEVLEVHEDSAVVRYQGEKLTLKIEGRP